MFKIIKISTVTSVKYMYFKLEAANLELARSILSSFHPYLSEMSTPSSPTCTNVPISDIGDEPVK